MYLIVYAPHVPVTLQYVPHVPATVVQRSKIRDFFATHPPLPPYFVVFEWSIKETQGYSVEEGGH